jgi:hypothetical protein
VTAQQAIAYNLRPLQQRDKRGRATGPGQTPEVYKEGWENRLTSQKQNLAQLHAHATKQGYAMQSEAKPKSINPKTRLGP